MTANNMEKQFSDQLANKPVPAIKKSIGLILKKPVIVFPLIFAEVILTALAFVLSPWVVELFDWWWVADLSYVPLSSILISAVFQVIVIAVTLLSVLFSLEMARSVNAKGRANAKESLRNIVGRFLPLLIVAFVGQALLLTVLLIPIGLLLFVIAIADQSGVGSAASSAVKFFRSNPADVLILVVILFGVRIVLSFVPIPHIFELSVASDIIVLIALLVLYISHKS